LYIHLDQIDNAKRKKSWIIYVAFLNEILAKSSYYNSEQEWGVDNHIAHSKSDEAGFQVTLGTLCKLIFNGNWILNNSSDQLMFHAFWRNRDRLLVFCWRSHFDVRPLHVDELINSINTPNIVIKYFVFCFSSIHLTKTWTHFVIKQLKLQVRWNSQNVSSSIFLSIWEYHFTFFLLKPPP